MSTLVLCPGHGVLLRPGAPEEDDSWCGVRPGEGALLAAHVREAVGRTAARPAGEATLVFSGAPTQAAAGGLSEAEGYLRLAEAAGWWESAGVAAHVLLEEYALDSLQNLLFALALHRLERGAYPTRVEVVGWAFKAERFALHARAIGWTRELAYVGVNDPEPAGGSLAAARSGEAAKRAHLEGDPLLLGPAWRAQRSSRNPTGRGEPYSRRLDEVARLLAGSGPPAAW